MKTHFDLLEIGRREQIASRDSNRPPVCVHRTGRPLSATKMDRGDSEKDRSLGAIRIRITIAIMITMR